MPAERKKYKFAVVNPDETLRSMVFTIEQDKKEILDDVDVYCLCEGTDWGFHFSLHLDGKAHLKFNGEKIWTGFMDRRNPVIPFLSIAIDSDIKGSNMDSYKDVGNKYSSINEIHLLKRLYQHDKVHAFIFILVNENLVDGFSIRRMGYTQYILPTDGKFSKGMGLSSIKPHQSEYGILMIEEILLKNDIMPMIEIDFENTGETLIAQLNIPIPFKLRLDEKEYDIPLIYSLFKQ
jgi:hypothetical protein